MTFEEVVDQALAMLQRRGRITYRMLQRHFQLDDAALEDLKEELLYGQRLAVDEDERVLVWIGNTATPTPLASGPVPTLDISQARAPLAYTPRYLAEKILTSRSALEGERKQVSVLFADLKGSMELLADRDPEEARQLLDPVLERMMAAVHRYEGTVNQVMGDGIMALFGAPLAHIVASHLGYAYALSGRVTEALPLLKQPVERADTMRAMFGQALWMTWLGEASLLAGCREDALHRAREALDLAGRYKGRGHQVYAQRLLGEIAAQRKPPESALAEAHYQKALTLDDELGMRPLQAHCHRGLGTRYATIGQREQARTELSTAIKMYQTMEMTFWIPQAEEALAQVTL
jgi:tetratricopeptide (TPR) repeat protein